MIGKPQLMKCQKCRIAKHRHKLCPGLGDPESSIVFIGEAPGEAEDKSGVPFVGSAGRVLDESLAVLGLERKKIYITNVVKCAPWRMRTNTYTGKREWYIDTPSEEEIENCLPFLISELKEISPKVVVLLGNVALRALSVEEKISKVSGKEVKLKEPLSHIKAVALFHPAMVLHNPKYRVLYRFHIRNVGKVLSKLTGKAG